MKTQTAAAENIIPLPRPRKGKKQFTRTRYANLFVNAAGKYVIRAKVHGRPVTETLDCSSLEIAKRKLDERLSTERERLGKKPDEAVTFADLAQQHLETVDASELKPTSKLYVRQCYEALERNCPALLAAPAVSISEEVLLPHTNALRKRYSGTRFNGQLTLIREVLRLARRKGLIVGDPSEFIQRKSIPITPPTLPEPEQFDALLAFLDANPRRKLAARLVRLMAYTGARISAAVQLRPEHIDLKAGIITMPRVKYDEVAVRVPIIGEMQKLAQELLADHHGDGPLIPVKSIKTALKTAGEALGIPDLTPHKLRHLFATRCIESGVDIPTVSRWLGHKDGGTLAMKVYGHLRQEHSKAMAQKVQFHTPPCAPAKGTEI